MALGTRVAVGLGGHLYVSAYAPGQIVLMVPLYALGNALARALSLPSGLTTLYASRSLDLLLGAALAVLFFLMASSMGYSRRTAVILTLIFGLATPAWPDAQSALEHTQISLALLLAVFAAWHFVSGGMRRRSWLVLCGAACGFGVFTRYDFAIYIPVLVLYVAALRVRCEGRGALPGDGLAYGLALLPWLALLMLWNQLRFGSPFNIALHLKTFGEPPWVGFSGLSVSPGKGIIWYMPLLFLLPWAGARFYRRIPSPALLFGALVAVTLVFYSTVLYWHGDPAWGPRYLYPVIPYCVLPLGEILARWRSEAGAVKGAVVLVVALSVVIQLAAVSVTQWRFWYHLQAAQERTAHTFNWGPTAYTYYWDVSQSPVLVQLEDVYQVVRLDAAGDRSQLLTRRPTACTGPTRCLSNPATDYPVNTLDFWWADTRHPLLDARAREALALLLLIVAWVAGWALIRNRVAIRNRPRA